MEDKECDQFPEDGEGKDGVALKSYGSTNGSKKTNDDCHQHGVPPLVPALNASIVNNCSSSSSSNNSTPRKSVTGSIGGGGSSEIRQRTPERSMANMFRSNVEGIEKPRQIIVLVITIAGASYLGFKQNDDDPDSNTRAATMGVSLIFLVHCFLQCRDTLFFRPHPGVWRVVHGIGMLYLFAIAVLLFHPKHEARRLLAIFIPDVKGYQMSKADLLASEPLKCDITVAAVLTQLRDVWFLAHLVGWWCKMCLFRDWGVCWVLSIGFELLELSMGWLVPQFHECWWDSLIIDLLGANLIGMTLGLYTLRFLETRTYDWNKNNEKRKLTGSLRLLAKFSPLRWSKWRWQAFSGFKRTVQVFAMVAVTMLLELNAFMVMNALEIPKTSKFNYVRLAVLFMVALLACNEFYEYCSNPGCSRLGQNLWLILAILQVEILTWIKFFPQPLLEASSPDDVKLPWLATLSLFSLWGLLFVAVSEESNSNNSSSNSSNSSSFCNVNKARGRAVEPRSSLATLDGNSSSSRVVNANGAHERDNGGSTNAVTASDAVPDAKLLPRRERSVSLNFRNSKRKAAMQVMKWGVVDAIFLLSFMPLLYLVKQWSY